MGKCRVKLPPYLISLMETERNQNQTPKPENSPLKEIALFFWDLVKIVLVALIIIIPFRVLVAEPFVVSGSSMLPNFHNKDYLIIDRVSYKFKEPQRGDVIVLKFPKDTSQYFIKRIVGLPGEQIKFEQGSVVIVNKEYPGGMPLKESYLETSGQTLGKNEAVNLGSGEYYVLGDNRTASSDSRVWGILPTDDIVGKVWLRVFPLNNFGWFETPEYDF
ncbi:MAG: signal peptidase I [Candidatus Doudnabacteria bacterium CG10_big_fil_rev_8_21_14_0_10_42_18]|uniref:Signal peptidase I n=1 Tax=Candidatus Doudnabacteria bacterium CG10_big_fil_rev_8_21_14_0_10_42_18 TaxID=1974552 RepID=A0A2H0VA36_9BACT|nr:MAG: signal peptidase I [Candidatus Doudnabacteria bacterium CG10_big_fil_rev_8_21_14_0_10_42_18]